MLYTTSKDTRYPVELRRALLAVDGYLTLGMPGDAREELRTLPDVHRHDRAVIRARIRILLNEAQWKKADVLAREGMRLYPDESEFMVQRAFALHQQAKEEEAIAVIRNAPEWLRHTGILHYNLACYEAQLGDLDTARQCIRAAIGFNEAFRKNAKKDPDLQRLWN